MSTLLISTVETEGVQAIVEHAWVWFIAPIGAPLALFAAFVFSRNVMSKSEGEPEMIRIAEAVRPDSMSLSSSSSAASRVRVFLSLL